VHLGRDDHLLARHHREQRRPGDLFAAARGVDVGGVEEVDAEIERLTKERHRVVAIERPGLVAPGWLAVTHATEADARDLEAGRTEGDVLHDEMLLVI
jgi:hypothetical protein